MTKRDYAAYFYDEVLPLIRDHQWANVLHLVGYGRRADPVWDAKRKTFTTTLVSKQKKALATLTVTPSYMKPNDGEFLCRVTAFDSKGPTVSIHKPFRGQPKTDAIEFMKAVARALKEWNRAKKDRALGGAGGTSASTKRLSLDDAAFGFRYFRIIPDETSEFFRENSEAGNSSIEEQPSIPKKPLKGEDSKTPRVSLAPSIWACIAGIQGNLTADDVKEDAHNREDCGGRVHGWYVYGTNATDVITTEKLKKLVPDAHLTGEVWSVKPVKMTLIGRVGGDFDENGEYQLWITSAQVGAVRASLLDELANRIEAASEKGTWYHGTTPQQWKKIQQDGWLRPNVADDTQAGSAIWFTTSLQEAKSYGKTVLSLDVDDDFLANYSVKLLHSITPDVAKKTGLPREVFERMRENAHMLVRSPIPADKLQLKEAKGSE